MLSCNEQIGVFLDFAACIPETIATSGKAYCKRIMNDVTRDAEKEQFYCVFYIDTVPLQSESLSEEAQNKLYVALRDLWQDAVLSERGTGRGIRLILFHSLRFPFMGSFECGMRILPADVWGRRLSG